MAVNLTNTQPASAQSQKSGVALYALMMLFFMMGFITCLNDILIPYLKAIFNLNYTQANLINLCFFGAYFVMSIPSGIIIQKLGYKPAMILGFFVAALGCLLFYPAAATKLYGLFLAALFVLASGITLLQVAGNPFVAVLGSVETASSRLTLTQAFNSVGTTIAPFFGSFLILSNLPKQITTQTPINTQSVQIPYLFIGGLLVLIAVILLRIRLPKITHTQNHNNNTFIDKGSVWNYRHLTLGAIGIFCYVGAEVAIGSHIVSFLQLPEIASFSAEQAGNYVSYYWGGAMVGRFIGSVLLKHFNPPKVLAVFAGIAISLLLFAVIANGKIAMWSILAIGLFNSLMFATIFTLSLNGLGIYTDKGSGILCTAIVGGALIPFLFGLIGDGAGLKTALWLPIACYAYIVYFGLKGFKYSG